MLVLHRPLEPAELIGIFQRDFGFVGDRFGHGWVSFLVRLALHRKIAEASFDLDQRKKRPVAARTTKFWRRTRPAVCGHPARYRGSDSAGEPKSADKLSNSLAMQCESVSKREALNDRKHIP